MSTSTFLPSHTPTTDDFSQPHASTSSFAFTRDSQHPRNSYAPHSSSSPFAARSPPASSRPSTSHKSPQAASPAHSTSSSISSTASSSSLMFTDSHGERGRPSSGDGVARTPRSQDGSVGSLATTVSSGAGSPSRDAKDTVMEEEEGAGEAEEQSGEKREDGAAPTYGVAALSVRDTDDDSNTSSRSNSGDALEVKGGKTRSSSMISDGSSSTAQTTPGQEAVDETNAGKSGRRKAARMGSFQHGAEEQSEQEGEPSTVQPTTAPTVQHVDIVSYPSNDLLRLLAALLEQIAQQNDGRNARTVGGGDAVPTASTSASAQPGPAAATSATSAQAPSTPFAGPSAGPRSSSSRRSSVDADWAQGRFDAAPLNTPVSTRSRAGRRLGGAGGPGILDNALDEGSEDEDEHGDIDETLPITPGVDLLRETGARGGVEGFMPSLGGTHRPQPLSRRRGSSFIRNRRNDDGTVPVASRRPVPTQTQSYSAAASSSSSSQSSAPPTRPPPAPTGASGAFLSSFTAFQSGSSNSTEPPPTSLLTASAVALSSPNATLCFHARNIPAISIEAYLLRILKYCPTTNEVFLSLLVYFDRMARIGLEARRMGLPREGNGNGRPREEGDGQGPGTAPGGKDAIFQIDSYNIHRLVIAGVTVASKFFSDVFYTNSRYAKVGGLPLSELNQLELQFLLLNDFRLQIPTDELQRYADQLILYWVGRNGMSNPQAAASLPPAPPAAASQPVTAPSAPAAASPAPVFRTPFTPAPPVAAPPSTTSTPAFQTSSHPSSSSSFAHPSHGNPQRPGSIRSHPSHSSGASISSSSVSSSTVTPGTPSTTRSAGSFASREGSEIDYEEYVNEEAAQGIEYAAGGAGGNGGAGSGERMETD